MYITIFGTLCKLLWYISTTLLALPEGSTRSRMCWNELSALDNSQHFENFFVIRRCVNLTYSSATMPHPQVVRCS